MKSSVFGQLELAWWLDVALDFSFLKKWTEQSVSPFIISEFVNETRHKIGRVAQSLHAAMRLRRDKIPTDGGRT